MEKEIFCKIFEVDGQQVLYRIDVEDRDAVLYMSAEFEVGMVSLKMGYKSGDIEEARKHLKETTQEKAENFIRDISEKLGLK